MENNTFVLEVVNLTNEYRSANGLSPLFIDLNLQEAAQLHSQNMANQDFFSHTGADGSSVTDRTFNTGYESGFVGENIGAGYQTPEDVVNGWINSPGHRENILNPNYNEIGVGYYFLDNDTGTINYNSYWTQVFGKGEIDLTDPDPTDPIDPTNPTDPIDVPEVDLPNLSIYNLRAKEDGNLIVTLHLSQPSNQVFQIDYETNDFNTGAKSEVDYLSVNGSVMFSPGETTQFLNINLIDDDDEEENETFKLKVSGVNNFSDNNFNITEEITIIDNDSLIDKTFDTPLIRFQNENLPGTYLFAGLEESNGIYQNYPNFVDEGLAFQVASAQADDLIRFNRFQNSSVPGTYLYAGEEESVNIRQNHPHFIEEGVAFYAYDSNMNKGVDFYRFQNTQQLGTYIFVAEQERQNILANFPQFKEEGVAFEAIV